MADLIFYNNPIFDVETKNRLLLPQVIDVSMTDSNYKRLLIDFEQKRFKVVEYDFRTFILNNQNMKHVKLSIIIDYSFVNREILLLPIHAKLEHTLIGGLSSPKIIVYIMRSTRAIFEWNGVYLTKLGIGVSSTTPTEFIGILAGNQLKKRITNDIIANRAIPVAPDLICNEVLSDEE